MAWAIYDSPLGPLTLRSGLRGLTGLDYPGRGGPLDAHDRDPRPFAAAVAQLEEYFAGERQAFDLPLDPRGTAFQQAVWLRLLAIPYGSTITYTELAHAIGRPDRIRAVAAAVGRTPLPILIPCHRVVAADCALTGYRGGLQRKRALLDLEGQLALL
jgi:methylated-DNA-[protein]-cysteine S-methyltransferase